MKTDDLGAKLAQDVQALSSLRARAKDNPREALQGAAQQFEALFLQMVLKNMRDTVPQDGLMANDQTRFYQSMFDDQLAKNLSGTGALGFAKLIEQQLGSQLPQESVAPLAEALYQSARMADARARATLAPQAAAAAAQTGKSASAAAEIAAAAPAGAFESPAEFVKAMWPHAVEAGAALGVPPQFLIAQAALESGWGRNELKQADGSSTFNVFGIKPGSRWSGPVSSAVTTEFIDGVASRQTQPFRAYGSYRAAFMDYAQLLSSRARFQGVVGQQDGAGFARGLQQAGYASDPMYADKLVRIIEGGTLRQALQAL